MTGTWWSAAALLVAMISNVLALVATTSVITTEIQNPTGVAVDPNTGLLFVLSQGPIGALVPVPMMTKFSADGATIIAQRTYPDHFVDISIKFEARTRTLLLLTTDGGFYRVNTDDLTLTPIVAFDYTTFTSTDRVFDVDSASVTSFFASVTRYNDFAILGDPGSNRWVVFVSGSQIATARALIIRVTFNVFAVIEARMVLSSLATTKENIGGSMPTPGIAVSSRGLVMTTMSVHRDLQRLDAGVYESIVVFGADYPENPAGVPVLLYGRDPSNGIAGEAMATDPNDNFYIASSIPDTGNKGHVVFIQAGTFDAFIIDISSLFDDPNLALLAKIRGVASGAVNNAFITMNALDVTSGLPRHLEALLRLQLDPTKAGLRTDRSIAGPASLQVKVISPAQETFSPSSSLSSENGGAVAGIVIGCLGAVALIGVATVVALLKRRKQQSSILP